MPNTLTPPIGRYLAERRGSGTYRTYSIGVVRGRLNSLATYHGSRPLDRLTRRRIEGWLVGSHVLPVARDDRPAL